MNLVTVGPTFFPYTTLFRSPAHLLDRPGQQAELVALRIGEDHPADLGTLAHVHPARPEIQEPLQLVLGAGPIGPQVEVQAILDALALRDLEHVDARPAPVTGRDADAVRVGLDHLPAQHCAPEVGDEAWSGGVDDDDGWTTGHGLRPASQTALRRSERKSVV